MKGNVRRSLMLAAVVAAVLLVVVMFTTAARPATPFDWEARLPRLQQKLERAGFNVHQASFSYIDLVDLNCHDKLFTSLANNPYPNAYLVMTDTHLLEQMDDYTDPRIDGIGNAEFPWFWQLREDEAFVMVGLTPPEAAYFSYMTVAMFRPDDPLTPRVEPLYVVGAQIGDTINNLTVNTLDGDPYNTPIVFIITGHRKTEQLVRQAAKAAGYPEAMINVQTLPPTIAPLGIGLDASVFYMANRAAVAKNQQELRDYLSNANTRMKVFRVTPLNAQGELQLEPVFAPDPEPDIVLRPKGTGHSEMDLYPALQSLRKAILDRYSPSHPYKELDTKIWVVGPTLINSGTVELSFELDCEKPYVVWQRGVFNGGCTRDNNYLATYPNFKLRSDVDEFVIAYGVNHQASGKSTYGSFSLYADKYRWIGVGTIRSPEFDTPCFPASGCEPGEPGDSARYYLSPDDPYYEYADKLYAWKLARHCNGEPFCMEIPDPYPFESFYSGETYYCKYVDWEYADPPLPEPPVCYNEEMFLLWRNYMEPSTAVGPDDNELVYDQAVYFGPYDFAPWECTPPPPAGP